MRMSRCRSVGRRPEVEEPISASGGACRSISASTLLLELEPLRHALLDEVGVAHRLLERLGEGQRCPAAAAARW